jgi:predicted XRE-type DNA-binding protein
MRGTRLQRKAELSTTSKTTKKTVQPVRIIESNGNVFADVGLPTAEQKLVKAQLTLQIYRIIKKRGITQAETAEILGVKQPHVSLLMRNRAGTFSVGRLMECLTALGKMSKSRSGRRARNTAKCPERLGKEAQAGRASIISRHGVIRL